MKARVVVEVDEKSRKYKHLTIYLTSKHAFKGVKVWLSLKPGVTVTDCWPNWPNEIGEMNAMWIANSYPRRFGSRVLYSYGVRMELRGPVRLPIRIAAWDWKRGRIRLKARGPRGFKAYIGPLIVGYKATARVGLLEEYGVQGYVYLAVEEVGGSVDVIIRPLSQPVVAGYLAYYPAPDEVPFNLRIEYWDIEETVCEVIVRLPDLVLD